MLIGQGAELFPNIPDQVLQMSWSNPAMYAQHNETAERENPEFRGPRQRRRLGPRVNTLAATIVGAIILAAAAFTPAVAQPPRELQHSDQERARIIRECMEMNSKYNTDPYGRTGGVEHMYNACMAKHGQPG